MADRAASSPLHPSPIESAEYKVRLVWHFRTLCATFFYALHCTGSLACFVEERPSNFIGQRKRILTPSQVGR